jgi:membrane fusion protein (multidrug efflux system)
MRLDFSVPEPLLAALRIGTPVRTANVAFPGRWFSGTVAVIDTRIDPLTRAVRVTALVDNPGQALRPGMFMNVSLEVATRENALLVPEEAIVGEGPRQLAFVVKDGVVERRVLQIGQRQQGQVEVLDGLAAGEALVVRGLQRVRQGLRVTARPFTSGQPPGSSSAPQPGPQAARPTTTN